MCTITAICALVALTGFTPDEARTALEVAKKRKSPHAVIAVCTYLGWQSGLEDIRDVLTSERLDAVEALHKKKGLQLPGGEGSVPIHELTLVDGTIVHGWIVKSDSVKTRFLPMIRGSRNSWGKPLELRNRHITEKRALETISVVEARQMLRDSMELRFDEAVENKNYVAALEAAGTLMSNLPGESTKAFFGVREEALHAAVYSLANACNLCYGSLEAKCDTCGGTGKEKSDQRCKHCDGKGVSACGICQGTGEVSCTRCGGAGRIRKKKYVNNKRTHYWDMCPTCGAAYSHRYGQSQTRREGSTTTHTYSHKARRDSVGTGTLVCGNCRGGKTTVCPQCKGSGYKVSRKKCATCRGKRRMPCPACTDDLSRPESGDSDQYLKPETGR